MLSLALLDAPRNANAPQVTGFSNSEEAAVQKTDAVPFLLEDEMQKLSGGHYVSLADWEVHALRDGRLVTGQNPQSSRRVAEVS